MKRLFRITLILTGLIFLFSNSNAQGNSQKKSKPTKTHSEAPNVKEKHHGPPPWAPAHGYRRRHIFFPDQKCYYDNTKGVYIYMNKNKWEVSVEIPLPLRNIDLKSARKVELDLDKADEPQMQFEEHMKLYSTNKKNNN